MSDSEQTSAGLVAKHSDRLSGRSAYIQPEDSSHYRFGNYYKVGRHELVFRWTGDAWVKARLNSSDLLGYEISKRNHA
jgi:hypothetical protein